MSDEKQALRAADTTLDCCRLLGPDAEHLVQKAHYGAIREAAAVRHLHLAGGLAFAIEGVANCIMWKSCELGITKPVQETYRCHPRT